MLTKLLTFSFFYQIMKKNMLLDSNVKTIENDYISSSNETLKSAIKILRIMFNLIINNIIKYK